MRTALRFGSAVAILSVLSTGSSQGLMPSQSMTPAHQRIIDRIFELQQEIDGLLAQLPAGLQDRVREDLGRQPAARELARPATRTRTTGAAGREATLTTGSGGAPSNIGLFDDNKDGQLTDADSTWRLFLIWTDTNDDGNIDRGEVKSMGNSRVRAIDTALRTFQWIEGRTGEVRRNERVELDLRANGFRSTPGVLCLDTDAAKAHGIEVRSGRGLPVTGVRPLERGWTLRLPDGRITILQ